MPLKPNFVTGGAAVDVDADEIHARGHARDVQAVATCGLDGAALNVEQFQALDPGVGTGDDVVALAAHLQPCNGYLVDTAGRLPEQVIEADGTCLYQWVPGMPAGSYTDAVELDFISIPIRSFRHNFYISPAVEIDGP